MSGRPSLYRGRKVPFSLVFTRTARDILARLQARSGLSRSSILDHLFRTADPLTFPPAGEDPYPGKVHQRLRVLLTGTAVRTLRRAMRETRHSPGVLGEYLIRTNRSARFPVKRPQAPTGAPQGAVPGTSQPSARADKAAHRSFYAVHGVKFSGPSTNASRKPPERAGGEPRAPETPRATRHHGSASSGRSEG